MPAESVEPAKRALKVFDRLQCEGVAPVNHSALMHSCGNTGDPERALKVLGRMQREGVILNIMTYSASIATCGKRGDSERVRGHSLQESIVQPRSLDC